VTNTTPNINYRLLKTWISDARTEEVLANLEEALRDNSSYNDYLNEVILLSSSFSTLEQGRRIDILNFQNYTTKVNQINQALLSILDDLEAGKELTRSVANIPIYPYWKMVMPFFIVMLILLGIVGGGIYYFINNGQGTNTSTPPPTEELWTCPTFKEGYFKVLILPFQNEPLPGTTSPYKLIASHLNDFSEREGLRAQIARIQPDRAINAIVYKEEADAYITKCEPDMLIWGQATIKDDKTAIAINYAILNPAEFEYISDFEPQGKRETLLTDALLPSTFKGTTQEIEEVLKKLLKVTVAFSNKDYPSVIKELEVSSTIADFAPSAAANMWISYAKAKSYRENNQIDKAIDAYSEVLAEEPTATLALNNRAQLNLDQENWDEALADFNTMENLDKADYEVFYKKGKIHEKLGNLGAAKEDFSRAKSVSPSKAKPTIESHLKEVVEKIEVEKRKISNTEKSVSSNPYSTGEIPNPGKPQTTKDLNELLQQAKANNRIGDTKKAEAATMKVLKDDPKNKKAMKELIRSKYFQDNSVDITELQKIPYLKDIDSAALEQLHDPVVKSIIRNGRVGGKGKKKKGKGRDRK